MAAISDNLIHFLARQNKDSPYKQFEIFKLIFENGLRTSQVTIKFGDSGTITNQVICFTDIPLRECNEHTSVYGKFGIGFKKSYIKNAGGNPARYFLDYWPVWDPSGAPVKARGALFHNLSLRHSFLLKLNKYIEDNPSSGLFDVDGNEIFTNEDLAMQVSMQILCSSFDKEMGDLGPARDETKEIDLYYKEREWRLVPSMLSDQAGISSLEGTKKSLLYKFQRDDVNMVVVPNEEMRNEVLEYLIGLKVSDNERLAQFGRSPLPIMNYDDLHRW